MKYFVISMVLLTGFSVISIENVFAEEMLILVENDVRKVYYTGENIISAFFNPDTASIIFETGANASLDIKAPKIYKDGETLLVLKNGEEVDLVKQSDECFYYITYQTKVPERIEIIFAHWPEATELIETCETFTVSPPLKQIRAGVALIDVKCNEGKVPAYKYNRMRVACVSLDTETKLILRGWATMRLAMPGDNISEALCNNYEGIWHPEYDACRGISDLQCTLLGGHFESLKICSGDICPNKPHSMCVTNSTSLTQSDIESQTLDLSKITFMKPNSIVFFYYPDPSDTKDRDAYETFMLVRLPEWLGGNSDDASAFRVYSAKAVDDPCLVKYWPQEGRQRIENPCRGGFYRIVDGTMIWTFGAVPGGAPIALPHLTLSIDENGFLFIEPPIWSKTVNGVLGYGREITIQEIREGSSFLIESFAKAYPEYPNIPLEFAGMILADITHEYDQRFKVFYSEFTPLAQNIEMFITKCDCDTLRSHPDYDEIENIRGTVVAIYDEQSRNPEISDSFNSYYIKFAKDGFEFEVIGKNLAFMKSSIATNFLNEN